MTCKGPCMEPFSRLCGACSTDQATPTTDRNVGRCQKEHGWKTSGVVCAGMEETKWGSKCVHMLLGVLRFTSMVSIVIDCLSFDPPPLDSFQPAFNIMRLSLQQPCVLEGWCSVLISFAVATIGIEQGSIQCSNSVPSSGCRDQLCSGIHPRVSHGCISYFQWCQSQWWWECIYCGAWWSPHSSCGWWFVLGYQCVPIRPKGLDVFGIVGAHVQCQQQVQVAQA